MKRRSYAKIGVSLGLVLLSLACASPDKKNNIKTNLTIMHNKTQISVQVPGSLVAEHEELHKRLYSATQLSGKTGSAAKNVAKLLHEHFIKEEKYAMPQLGWLQTITNDKFVTDESEIIKLSTALKQDLPGMLAEHREIVAELENLINAAKDEDHPEVIEFAKALKLHALTEEEVLYPTAILIGEYLKLKNKKGN